MNIMIPVAELNSQIIQILIDNNLTEDLGELPPFDWPLPDSRFTKYINNGDFYGSEDTDVVDLLTAIDYVIGNSLNQYTDHIVGDVTIDSIKMAAKGLLISIGIKHDESDCRLW